MKYYINLLDSLKRGDIAPVYLFHGPEAYLRHQALGKFRKTILSGGAEDFNLNILDGQEVSAPEIISLAETAPFFADKRLIIVNDPPQFKGSKKKTREEEQEAEDNEEDGETSPKKSSGDSELLQYITSPMPSTCVIFNTPGPVDKRKKIYRTIEKNGRVVEFALLKSRELIKWLEKQARLAGKQIEPGAAETLIERVGHGLFALQAEINKLIDYTGESPVITREDVTAVTPVPLEEDIFRVVDAIGNKNPATALAGLRDLLLTRHPPQVILSMVARQFRLLLQVKQAVAEGCPAGELAGRTGIHPFVAKKILSQAKNFNFHHLVTTIHSLQAIDVGIKTGRREFLPAMEMLIMEICIHR